MPCLCIDSYIIIITAIKNDYLHIALPPKCLWKGPHTPVIKLTLLLVCTGIYSKCPQTLK